VLEQAATDKPVDRQHANLLTVKEMLWGAQIRAARIDPRQCPLTNHVQNTGGSDWITWEIPNPKPQTPNPKSDPEHGDTEVTEEIGSYE
jgi:hypothetical protein